jgi:hypothetical protein
MIINTLWGEEEFIETKTCRRCSQVKTIDNFEVNRKFASGGIARRAYCIDCGKKQKPIANRKYYEKKPKELFCPTCGDTVTGSHNIVLDHNHTTGQIRGYICDNCNTGMGRAKDDVKILHKWIEWLNK